MTVIPPRQDTFEDKERRFYVVARSSVYLQLQQEAIGRGTDLWTLCGSVLTAWLHSGCPDFDVSDASEPASVSNPPPSSSPSRLADDQGDAE